MTKDISEIAKAVVRRNTMEVQGGGNWQLFDTLFADDFYDARHSLAAHATRPECLPSTSACDRPFQTSRRRFTGSVPTEML